MTRLACTLAAVTIASALGGPVVAEPGGAHSSPAAHSEYGVFPASFRTVEAPVRGGTVHVRIGGRGPAVLLLHGFGDTGDMWAPAASALMATHTVIVPDLRGMGLSSHPTDGYRKQEQADDMAAVLKALGVSHTALVTHDIGNMVGFALAMRHRDLVSRWMVIDAPLPGVGHWDEITRDPHLWHFNFRGPDVERLVAGRERIYLDRFYNELSANPAKVTPAIRTHYAALYARPGAMHDAFEQFAAFPQDAKDNAAMLASLGKLTIPVLAVGADHSFGSGMADELRFAATDVTGRVVADSGHWIMEEQPQAVVAMITGFVDGR